MLEFGFDEDSNLGNKIRRFKGNLNERYRFSFAWWKGSDQRKPQFTPDNPEASPCSPKFIAAKRFYVPGVGYFMDKGPEYQKIAGATGPGKVNVATLIISWPIDEKGNLNKTRFNEGAFQVYPWIFSKDKYDTIKQNHDQFPLGLHDLSALCTDANFQKMTFTPCRENLFAKLIEKSPEMASKIHDQVIELIAALPNELAQDLTIDEIKTRLAKAGGAQPGKFEDSGRSGGGAARAPSLASSSDFDAMLDDLVPAKG